MATTSAADLCIERFRPVLGDVMMHGHTHYWLHGGRGSTKSSFISLCLVLLTVANPEVNVVVVRRFGNTLRDSVYTQVLWAVDALGLSEYFKAKISPLEIVYLPTGQRIVFRGCDDPLKLKSTKFAKGYCACIWFEELDQHGSIEDVRSVLNSLRRGGSRFWVFYSFNPPKTAISWVNKETLARKQREDTLVWKTSYLDVVASHPEWLGGPFIEEAEYLREANETAWRWEFLGDVVGTGGNVFSNIVEREVTDEEIRTFERVRNGLDWGWWPDPWRFVRCEWQPGSRRLIIFEEHTTNKMTPEETGRIVLDSLTYADEPSEEPYYHDQVVWVDDTPDGKVQTSVYRRDLGIRARPARKGRMRKLSYEWLAGLREVVIDPVRCPLTFEEFAMKEYERDRDGNWLDIIPDGDDHSIDAVHYAVMDDVLRG